MVKFKRAIFLCVFSLSHFFLFPFLYFCFIFYYLIFIIPFLLHYWFISCISFLIDCFSFHRLNRALQWLTTCPKLRNNNQAKALTVAYKALRFSGPRYLWRHLYLPSLSLTLPQPHWPSCCFSDMQDTFPNTRVIGTDFLLCLEVSFPRYVYV